MANSLIEPLVESPAQEGDHLSELVGTTRSTVNRVLRVAESNGAIRLARGRIEILDSEALDRLAR